MGLNKKTPIGELMAMFPDGFVVSPTGTIERVVKASSHLNVINAHYPIPPENGGYIVVEGANISIGFMEETLPSDTPPTYYVVRSDTRQIFDAIGKLPTADYLYEYAKLYKCEITVIKGNTVAGYNIFGYRKHLKEGE